MSGRNLRLLLIAVCLLAVLSACENNAAPATSGPAAPPPETQGLMVYYDMAHEGATLLDKSGNGNHAALHGSYEIEDGALFLENGGYAQLPGR